MAGNNNLTIRVAFGNKHQTLVFSPAAGTRSKESALESRCITRVTVSRIQQRLESFHNDAHVWAELSFILQAQSSYSSILFPRWKKDKQIIVSNCYKKQALRWTCVGCNCIYQVASCFSYGLYPLSYKLQLHLLNTFRNPVVPGWISKALELWLSFHFMTFVLCSYTNFQIS